MAGNFNLQRILGNMPGMAGGPVVKPQVFEHVHSQMKWACPAAARWWSAATGRCFLNRHRRAGSMDLDCSVCDDWWTTCAGLHFFSGFADSHSHCISDHELTIENCLGWPSVLACVDDSLTVQGRC